jgi:hypothetical protein
VRESLSNHFAGIPSRLVLADGGSTDGTAEQVRQVMKDGLIEVPYTYGSTGILDLPYHGLPGRNRALRNILTTARQLEARVCVTVDGSIQVIDPQWIDSLVGPVLKHDFDFVSPRYRRHPWDGALTKGIAAPLFRALFGVRIHQPHAVEFACSSRLLGRWLEESFWDAQGAQFAVDLWLTMSAVGGDFRLGEAMLGVGSHRARGETALDLPAIMTQVVGSLFDVMETRASTWQRVRGSTPVQQFDASGPARVSPAESPSLDIDRLLDSFRLGYRELKDVWAKILPPRTVIELGRLAAGQPERFRLDDDLWARIVYDFALGYRLRVLSRGHVLQSLVPLYLAWVASFGLRVRDVMEDAEAEQIIDQLGVAFEAQKPYLIGRWRWPERART